MPVWKIFLLTKKTQAYSHKSLYLLAVSHDLLYYVIHVALLFLAVFSCEYIISPPPALLSKSSAIPQPITLSNRPTAQQPHTPALSMLRSSLRADDRCGQCFSVAFADIILLKILNIY